MSGGEEEFGNGFYIINIYTGYPQNKEKKNKVPPVIIYAPHYVSNEVI